MLVSVYNNGDGDIIFTSNGCGCCSVNYDMSNERDEIIAEIKRNIDVAKEACKYLGIDFNTLL